VRVTGRIAPSKTAELIEESGITKGSSLDGHYELSNGNKPIGDRYKARILYKPGSLETGT